MKCRKCANEMEPETRFCGNCGMPTTGLVKISLFQPLAWFKAYVRPLKTERSEFDAEETEFRVKTAREELSRIGLGIVSGFMKALAPVLITNLAIILVLTGWIGKDIPDDELREVERLRDISLVTFVVFLVAIPVSLFLIVRWLTPALVRNRRHAQWADLKVQAVRSAIIQAMGQYDGHMPVVKSLHFRRHILDDQGKVKRDIAREDWRQDYDIPSKMQADFESAHHELVGRMDNLRDLVKKYYDEYDDYSDEFQKQYFLKTRPGGQTRPLVVNNDTKDAITSSFLFFSGEIQNEADLQNAQDRGEVDPNTQKWLQAFFDGDPLNSSTISSLQLNADLKAKGKRVSEERAKAQHEWDEVRMLVKETRAGRGGHQ